MPLTDDLLKVLQQRFGYPTFRGVQAAVIQSLVRRDNVLLIMPTGMGKSLCYQLPSDLREGITLVISPLIALMQDQVAQARRIGLAARAVHSLMRADEREAALRAVSDGQVKLLYLTPERFRKPSFWDAIKGQKIALLAVDEAHCISQWGHDFRPEYRRLGEIRTQLGCPVTIALTATATPEVQADILAQLRLPKDQTQVFIQGVERPELILAVESVARFAEKILWMVRLRHQHPGPAIFYFSLIGSLHQAATELERLGIPHFIYHGQMPATERRRQQEAFMSDPSGLMLATPAFGLGINKSDIRLIVHAEIPGSLEAYYQEVGRAGRDGQPAHGYLLFDPDDISIQMDFLKWGNPDPEFLRTLARLVEENPDPMRAEGAEFLRGRLNFYNRRDFRVETALNLLSTWGYLQRPEKRGETWQVLEPLREEDLEADLFEARLKRQREKLLEVVRYARSEDCRLKTIYSYFGVEGAANCGHCDRCRASVGTAGEE